MDVRTTSGQQCQCKHFRWCILITLYFFQACSNWWSKPWEATGTHTAPQNHSTESTLYCPYPSAIVVGDLNRAKCCWGCFQLLSNEASLFSADCYNGNEDLMWIRLNGTKLWRQKVRRMSVNESVQGDEPPRRGSAALLLAGSDMPSSTQRLQQLRQPSSVTHTYICIIRTEDTHVTYVLRYAYIYFI